MPEELSVADVVNLVGEEWADRVTVSKLLKAFAIEPSGKVRGPNGGRPSIMYPAASVLAMLEIVNSSRGAL